MSLRPWIFAAVLVAPLSAMAESPNIAPGLWQFDSVTTVKGDLPIPDQTDSHQECIAQGDLDDADFQFLEVEEGCELVEHNVSVDGVEYSMVCHAEGGVANIDGYMSFLGERVEGNVNIETESPIGQMIMETTIEGQRVGDC